AWAGSERMSSSPCHPERSEGSASRCHPERSEGSASRWHPERSEVSASRCHPERSEGSASRCHPERSEGSAFGPIGNGMMLESYDAAITLMDASVLGLYPREPKPSPLYR